MAFSNEQIENLSNLLMSTNELNAKIAFEIIESNELPVSLLSELFAFFKTTDNKILKSKAKNLLEKNGSRELIEAIKMRMPLKRGKSNVAATEKTIKKNIIQYTHNNELDGIKIAKALYKKTGVGATYLLTATPAHQRKEMLKTFISGTTFKLNNKAITQFPPELFEFSELTSIDLSQNKITSIPKEIEVFENLQVLNLSHNKLRSIHNNILKLRKLKELSISHNDFTKKFPEIIFKISQLQKLNIVQVRGNSCWYEELPKAIYNLKYLESFESDNNNNRPSYPNYPSIKKVLGSPIDIKPLAIAYAAYDQGDVSPIYYILKYGSKDRILGILNRYYNPNTQTMNLESVHIEQIPEEIKQFKIKILLLKNCGLGTYYGNYSYTPEILDRIKRRSVSRTAILNELTDLEVLDLSQNVLCEIADLSKLENLRELNLNRNKFGYFPLGLTSLYKLETLQMSGNYPTSSNRIAPDNFPNELKNLKSLKLFRVSIQGMISNRQYFMDRLEKLIPNCEIKIG